MNLDQLIEVANSDPERGRYKLVLYKEDGIFWTRRGEAKVPQQVSDDRTDHSTAPEGV